MPNSRNRSLPLTLGNEGEILFPNLEPVMGWSAAEAASRPGAPQPLRLSFSLLDPSPTTEVIYACNLPAPIRGDGSLAAGQLFLDASGTAPEIISLPESDDFVRMSLPGGQIDLYRAEGPDIRVKFRWLLVTSGRFIGSLWRCYAQIKGDGHKQQWRALAFDYIFDSDFRACHAPEALNILPPSGKDEGVRLVHPKDEPSQFPAAIPIVKVRTARANGWPRRSIDELRFLATGEIAAHFSDGRVHSIGQADIASETMLKAA